MERKAILDAIKAECGHLNQIEAKIRATMENRPENWKMTYVALRRELSICYGRLSSKSNELLLGLAAEDVPNAYLQSLSKLRSATAVHQASWPVVSIHTADSDYRSSLAGVEQSRKVFENAANQLFQWLESRK